MRVAIAVVLAFLLHASPAAAGRLACDLEGGGSEAYQERLGPLLAGASEEAKAVLGAQIAGYWLSNRDQGWDMGVAPGPLTVEQARIAIGERLAARFEPGDADYLMSALHLYDMPYSDAELRPLADQLDGELRAALGDRIFWTVGVGCLDGEAWRVETGLYADATADDIAQVREILAPHGDKVRLYLDGLLTHPGSSGGTAASRLRSFVALRSPKRCVRAAKIRFRARRSARAVIRRAMITVRGRRRRLAAEPLTVRLGRRITRVRVVVRAGDGSRIAHTYAYRRC